MPIFRQKCTLNVLSKKKEVTGLFFDTIEARGEQLPTVGVQNLLQDLIGSTQDLTGPDRT